MKDSSTSPGGRRDRVVAAIAALLLVIVATASFLQVQRHDSGLPFEQGWIGRNGARYAVAARNLLRHPLAATRGWPCFECGDVEPERLTPYVRHPPGFTWLVTGSFAAFGQSEDAARAVPLAATVLLVGVLFEIASRRGSKLAGATAAAAFLLLPMTQTYGMHVDMQSSPTALCIALAVAAATWLVERGSRRARTLLLVSLAVGMALDWPAWIAAGVLALALAWKRERRLALAIVVLVLVEAALLLGYVIASAGLEPLTDAVHERTTSFWGLPPAERNLAGFWRRMDAIQPMWLWPVAAFSATVALVAGGAAKPVAGVRTFPAGAILFAIGALYDVAFPIGLYIHEYWSYLLAPPLALLFAFAVESTERAWPRARMALAAALVLLALPIGWFASSLVVARLDASRESRHRIFAEALREATSPDARILTNCDYNVPGQLQLHPQFSWYADRDVIGGVLAVRDVATARATFEPTHYFELPLPRVKLDPELKTWLERNGVPSRMSIRNARLWTLAKP